MASLLLYLGSLVGRGAIGLTVWRAPSLHTPMCVLLLGPALLEIARSPGAVPRPWPAPFPPQPKRLFLAESEKKTL